MKPKKSLSKVNANPMRGLTKNDQQAVVEFIEKLRQKFRDRVRLVKLFGSKARGEAEIFSDIDLFVVLETATEATHHAVNGLAAEINLKYDVVLSPLIHSLAEYQDPKRRITPFFKTVMREGLAV